MRKRGRGRIYTHDTHVIQCTLHIAACIVEMSQRVPKCCLCLCTTIENTRGRLCTYIDACADARQVLESLSSTYLLQQLLGLPTAVLCSGCQRDLSKIAKLDRELVVLKAKVMANNYK